MRIVSGLLSQLALVTQRNIPGNNDGELELQNRLAAVIQLCEPFTTGNSQTTGVGQVLTPQTTSHILGYTGSRAIGAGSTVDRVISLAQGLWEVDFNWAFQMPSLANSNNLEILMGTPSGSGGGAGRIFDVRAPGSIIVLSGSAHFRIAVPVNHTFLANWTSDNTAGATLMVLGLAGWAQKLAS